MQRASNSGRKLMLEDVACVKGMLLRGDRQHDIASWFGVNAARIAEISKGHKHLEVKPNINNIPPPGPYPTASASLELIRELRIMRNRLIFLKNSKDVSSNGAELLRGVVERADKILSMYDLQSL